MNRLVDARGLSCPEPVLLTKNALRDWGRDAFVVLVDAPTPRENVSRLLGSAGRQFEVVEDGGAWRIEVAGA